MSRTPALTAGGGLLGLIASCALIGSPVCLAAPMAAIVAPSGAAGSAELLRQLSSELGPVLAASRPVLLGSRDPAGRSCVPLCLASGSLAGLQPMARDPAGGPGTALTDLWCLKLRRSAASDHAWQQGPFRAEIDRRLKAGRDVAADAVALADKARRLALGDRAWAVYPPAHRAATDATGTDWPGTCLGALGRALAAGDAAGTRRWAAELAAATAALADLHRWRELAMENYLLLLDFQAMSADICPTADQAFARFGKRYDCRDNLDGFAASAGATALLDNLLEVERQAERLYAPPVEFSQLATAGPAVEDAAVWMPPDARATFVFLRSVLSPANRATWDRAAASPYERSYLANMIFRLTQARTETDVAVALRRFDRRHPKARMHELMDAIFYRGEPCGAIVWSDRFDDRLLRRAAGLRGDGLQVLRGAHEFTHGLLDGWANYRGNVWLLHEALDQRKLDCVRGTDMIGSLYRNAGEAGYLCVHLSCAVASHSVSAAEADTPDGPRIFVMDSLCPPAGPQTWPEAYFHGFRWPKGYPGDRGPAFTAELGARGLDNYLFAEGYVIVGPKAGTLLRAAIPYLPGREAPSSARVYAGPFPPPFDPHAAAAAGPAALAR